MRWLLLIHRYLGIGVALLMAVWCLSGFVMIYVPYPALSESVRVDAATSSNAATIDYDQWTVSGDFDRDRPLRRIALDDAQATEIYVSSKTGAVVQQTTAKQRIWNWFGAVPHWLYFTELRHNAGLWTQIVIWTAVMGCILTITGLCVGIYQFTRPQNLLRSPYRGVMIWHHILGLIFGLFAFTWVASGLISMNPWGFLESERDAWLYRWLFDGLHKMDFPGLSQPFRDLVMMILLAGVTGLCGTGAYLAVRRLLRIDGPKFPR